MENKHKRAYTLTSSKLKIYSVLCVNEFSIRIVLCLINTVIAYPYRGQAENTCREYEGHSQCGSLAMQHNEWPCCSFLFADLLLRRLLGSVNTKGRERGKGELNGMKELRPCPLSRDLCSLQWGLCSVAPLTIAKGAALL